MGKEEQEQTDPTLDALAMVASFKTWLNDSGRGYLQEGLGHLPPGQAFEAIFRRANLPFTSEDPVSQTLPIARRLIEKNCPPSTRKP